MFNITKTHAEIGGRAGIDSFVHINVDFVYLVWRSPVRSNGREVGSCTKSALQAHGWGLVCWCTHSAGVLIVGFQPWLAAEAHPVNFRQEPSLKAVKLSMLFWKAGWTVSFEK